MSFQRFMLVIISMEGSQLENKVCTNMMHFRVPKTISGFCSVDNSNNDYA